jgi:hypothetical protein
MNIAVCLFGFIRNESNIDNITHFFNKINTPELKKMTIYYSCPSKIEETDDNLFDKNHILNLFKIQENEKVEIIISFRDYDKQTYIDYANDLNLPHITCLNYHSYRIISCLNSITESSKMIDNPNFNFIIFSRLDLINYILSINKIFDNNSILHNTAYIWRTQPYITYDCHVEDRFFICSNECIDIVKGLISFVLKDKNIKNELQHFFSEKILGKLFNSHENIKKYHLHNMEISNDINNYLRIRDSIKYSHEFMNSM